MSNSLVSNVAETVHEFLSSYITCIVCKLVSEHCILAAMLHALSDRRTRSNDL
jgi:hypothetical protein